jgi:hypothetical protein
VPLLYFLPSLGYAVFLSLNSGNPTLLFLVAGSVLAMQLGRGFSSIRPDGDLEFLGNRVRIGGRLLPRAPGLWPAPVRDRIYLAVCARDADQLEAFERERQLGGLLLGVDLNGQPLRLELADHRAHLLVIGPTGSGKTILLRQLAAGWSGSCWVVDYKGGMGFAGHPAVQALVTNLSENRTEFWAALNQLLDRREAGEVGQRLLIVVDELGAVIQERDAASSLERVVTKGRSLGVHLMAANQTLSGVSRNILTNCQLRVGVGNVDTVDRAQLGQAKPCPPGARAVLIDHGQDTAFWFSFEPQPHLKPPEARGDTKNPLARNSDFAGDAGQQSRHY